MPPQPQNNRSLYLPGPVDWWWNDCYLIRRHLWKAIRKEVAGIPGTILDFGCGSKPYHELFAGRKYVGVDIAASGHDHADSRIDLLYDGRSLNFPDATFDAVISTEVLEHLFNYDDILRELFRVLRPGGVIFLTTPFIWPEHEQPYDYARYTSYGLEGLLERHGFEEVRVERRGHALEVIGQLSLSYARQKLVPPVPLMGRALGIFWCCLFNLAAMTGAQVLPDSNDIYLSNVARARKPAAPLTGHTAANS